MMAMGEGMEVKEAISLRRSIRRYRGEPVPKDIVEVVDAAHSLIGGR